MARILLTVLLATAAVVACSAATVPDVDSKIGEPITVNTAARTEQWGRHSHPKIPSSDGKKKFRMMKQRKKEMRNKNKRFSDRDGGNRRQLNLKSRHDKDKKNKLAKKIKFNKKNRFAKKNKFNRKNKFTKKFAKKRFAMKKKRSRKSKGDSRKNKNKMMRKYEKGSDRELSMELGPFDETPSVVRTQYRGNRRSSNRKKKNRSGKNKVNKNSRFSKKGRSRKHSKKNKFNKRRSRYQKKGRSRKRND